MSDEITIIGLSISLFALIAICYRTEVRLHRRDKRLRARRKRPR